jgi:hypothetical protein
LEVQDCWKARHVGLVPQMPPLHSQIPGQSASIEQVITSHCPLVALQERHVPQLFPLQRHVPLAWQTWPSPHVAPTLTAPLVQTPAWHVSLPTVQGSPVLQDAPVLGVGGEQTPVAGSQTPGFWHVPALHVTPAQQSALQTPSAHWVSPAQQVVPLGAVLPARMQQVPAMQTSAGSLQAVQVPPPVPHAAASST